MCEHPVEVTLQSHTTAASTLSDQLHYTVDILYIFGIFKLERGLIKQNNITSTHSVLYYDMWQLSFTSLVISCFYETGVRDELRVGGVMMHYWAAVMQPQPDFLWCLAWLCVCVDALTFQ